MTTIYAIGIKTSKEVDTGVLRQRIKQKAYTVSWRQHYIICHRGRNLLTVPVRKQDKLLGLTQCKASLNTRLLKLEQLKMYLQSNSPLNSAHDGPLLMNIPTKWHKPLPEIISVW